MKLKIKVFDNKFEYYFLNEFNVIPDTDSADLLLLKKYIWIQYKDVCLTISFPGMV